jgi:hypothetical protein
MHIGYWWDNQKERTIRTTKRSCVDIIKIDLRVIELVGMD